MRWIVSGLGEGITSVAVAGGKVYTLGYRNGGELVFALDAFTGETRWASRIGKAVKHDSFSTVMRWLSPRVPTVDEDRVYSITTDGDLTCLRTDNGAVLWAKNYAKEFLSKPRPWGFCDYPLVDGEKLICVPGGPEVAVVALNKRTGEIIWQTVLPGNEKWHYAAPVLSTGGGFRHYVVFLDAGLTGIAADDGRVLWRYAGTVGHHGNSYTPTAKEDLVFSANGYDGGMALLKLVNAGSGIQAIEQYHRPFNFNPFQDNTVLIGSHVYAIEGPGTLVCFALHTGEPLWKHVGAAATRRAAITYADGHLYVRRSDGSMTLVEANSGKYIEKSSFTIPDPHEVHGVTTPVVAGRRLFLRDNSRLLCYDVSAGALTEPQKEPRHLVVTLTGESSYGPAALPGSAPGPDAIYVPTPADVVDKMLGAVHLTNSSVLYDLGSGDGRIVTTAAQRYGCRAVGFEIDPLLVQESRQIIETNGLQHLARIEHTNLFEVDLSEADVVAVYLPTNVLLRLRPQFDKLKPGARIVSHQFQIPGIPPTATLDLVSQEDGDRHRVFIWTVPPREGM